MKAYQITKPGVLTKVDINETANYPDAVKVKMTRCGLSVIDAHLFEGKIADIVYPIVPIRHGVGIVSEQIENSSLMRGTRVVLDPYYVCGKCYNCSVGNPKNCEKIRAFGRNTMGFLRDFVSVPYSNVYELPDQVKDNEGIFVEHISTSISIINQLNIKPGEYIAIIGASIVGTILAQAALYYQAIPILIDNFEDKLEIAKNLGIYYTINSSVENPVNRIRELTGGRMCECVAYMSNSNEKIQRALDCAAFNGRISLVGWETVNEMLSANISGALSKKLTIYGMQNNTKYIAQSINLLANKKINVAPLISEEIKFDQSPEYFEKISKNPYLYHKIVISV